MNQSCCTAAEHPDFSRFSTLSRKIASANLFAEPSATAPFRVGLEPLPLDRNTVIRLEKLGTMLHRFNQTVQTLYFASRDGRQPSWVAEYLEMGKPELVRQYVEMRRFRKELPRIIRPDLILTDAGFTATELDSVPGGFGLTAALSQFYHPWENDILGGATGILDGFMSMIQAAAEMDRPTTAILVSDESNDYRGEMEWLAQSLRVRGSDVTVLNPNDILFQEDGLYMGSGRNTRRVHIVYRFFELFDLKNIPKMDLLLYAVRKKLAIITPPLKHIFEEKLLFGLFHHPQLANFWLNQLGHDTFENLQSVFPESWIVDTRPVAPHGIIPGLTVGGQAINDWLQLASSPKKEREFVLKISGFSEKAWGSRGVTIGHDVNSEEWQGAIETALRSFNEGSPYVLQRFHKGRRVKTSWWDDSQQRVQEMTGRVRLCPYYFVYEDEAHLAGTLATICPLNKKLIHGMTDAVMVPTKHGSKKENADVR